MFTFKNKIKIIIVLIFFFNIGLYAADNEANLEISGFKIYTEEPMVYFYNGETEVIAPDIEIVNEILKSFNSSDKIEILSWDAAYKKTLEETNAILFSTALNEERKNLFKWAGPIGSVDNSFFALKKSDIKIKDADDLKKIKSIGVLKDYFNEQQLKKAAFQNLVYVENDYDAIKKLFNKEIDLYASNSYAFPVFMKILSKNLSEIEKVFTLSTSLLYAAFNINAPDTVVEMWQKKIDDMKKNRSFKEYYKKAYPDFDYFIPDILQLVTEDYPPITFEKNGKMSGVAVEIVEEIIKRLNMPNNIKLMYWDDAYQMALINPNVILFSTTRTEKRENLFHWLGPIGSYNDNLYVKKGSGLKAESLDDAKKFKSIGTVNGWFSQELLQKENFQNLSKTPSPVECAKWLFDGTVEAGVFTDMTAPDIFNKAGFSIDDLEKILSLKKYEFYVSISKGTPEKTIELWRETFDEMKRDGTLREILKRWIP